METGKNFSKPNLQEKYEIIKEHIELAIKEKGEKVALNEMRKHISWYTKNMPNSSEFRDLINHTDNKEELMRIIKEYFAQ